MAEVDDHSTPGDADDISKPSLKAGKDEPIIRKVICRYGSGCTHILDPAHREKFWHPKVQRLEEDQIKSHFICNECGFATNSLQDLQLHLKRKTAWSNSSLIGCRVNCLVDYKEWHEGYVTQYHKSGKHMVEFRMVNEKRWLLMKKVAFYIVERPVIQNNDNGEFKETNSDHDNLAPVEESWVYCEDITLEYSFAQSVLFKIYGNSLQETGHLTRGHVCLTESDRVHAVNVKSSLLYGELLPRGANKAFGLKRLEAHRATSLFDMGMGTGKIVIQAFLQFRNLKYCYGVELSQGRYKLAEEAAIKMVHLLGAENYNVQIHPGKCIVITEAVKATVPSSSSSTSSEEVQYTERVLHFQCGNMFDTQNLDTADIIMMETDFPSELFPLLHRMISSLKEGTRILSYLDLRRLNEFSPIPLKQLEINRHLSDRYPTSWSVQRGHHFFLWQKTGYYEHNSSWSNGIALGLGALVSHDNSGSTNNYLVGNGSPMSPANKTGNSSGNSIHHQNPLSREGSIMESNNDDVDSTRCFPFGFRFGLGSRSKKAKKAKTGEDISPPRVVIPVNGNIIKPSAHETAGSDNNTINNGKETGKLSVVTAGNDSAPPKIENPQKMSSSEASFRNNNLSPTKTATNTVAETAVDYATPVTSNSHSAGANSNNHNNNGKIASPPKPGSKSSSTPHGNLILNNSDDILDYPTLDHQFTPIQRGAAGAAGNSNDQPDAGDKIRSSPGFPADIRSKIRSSPLIEYSTFAPSSTRVISNKEKEREGQVMNMHNGSTSSHESSPVRRDGTVKKSKKRSSPSPRRSDRVGAETPNSVTCREESSKSSHRSSPSSKSKQPTPDEFFALSSAANRSSPTHVNDLPSSGVIPPGLLTSNDVVHHTHVKPAVTAISSNAPSSSVRNSNDQASSRKASTAAVSGNVESYYNNKNYNSSNRALEGGPNLVGKDAINYHRANSLTQHYYPPTPTSTSDANTSCVVS